eukprot:TRINITY_DN29801_c0_g1_i2.p1 TRINITY_DN29801_c0_g1~~TRINITY_DN29801_c0_g1_i2.p1  ORF type:complete len:866 (+),score=393.79 TRINITY_DN29801_c0_g1_i2:153-2750(+)
MADKPADDSIKVCARFRPLNRLEVEAGGREVLTMGEKGTPKENTVELRLNLNEGGKESVPGASGGAVHKFTFDSIFGANSEQEDIYEIVGRPVVTDIFKGYNGTIFVYGQTGSGKSHTMMGPSTDGYCSNPQLKGIIPRVVEQIFVNVENSDPAVEFSIKVSYVEIYMEKIRDLLEPSKVNLQLREDFKGGKGVYIADATEQYVADPEEIFQLMKDGASNRVVASTQMNDVSSRSHAIFSLSITQKHSVKLDQKTGKLYLVDLAGSEKVGKTKAEGQQLEEAKLINKSLSSLGQVITALTDKKATHVPYRDSKLTRLLQDSLGGNSRTSLIICGSMSEYNQHETLSTMRFGQRAKSIKNNAKINRELTVGEYKILLEKLEKELAILRKNKGLPLGEQVEDRDTAADTAKLEAELLEQKDTLTAERAEIEAEIAALRETDVLKSSLLQQYQLQVGQYEEEVSAWETEYDQLQTRVTDLHSLLEREHTHTQERVSLMMTSADCVDHIGQDAMSLKVALQKIVSLAEQDCLASGGQLEEEQEREVAQWRSEREKGRKEEASFRTALLEKIQAFSAIDRGLIDSNTDRMQGLLGQLADVKKQGWGAGCAPDCDPATAGDPDADVPASPEGKDAEITRLRRSLRKFTDIEAGDDATIPRALYAEATHEYNKEIRDKNVQIAKLKTEMERYVGETKELRNSLLKDLQTRCEKVIDLELALDEQREQYKNLMIASSNKLLRKRVRLLEAQNTQQTGNVAQILNENSTLRLEYKLAEKKLAIRNERIENLKTGLKEEKRHIKELRENANAERAKYRQECARYREEVNFWKDKCLKSAATAVHQSTSKAGRIIKVLKGGQKHEQPSPAHADPEA